LSLVLRIVSPRGEKKPRTRVEKIGEEAWGFLENWAVGCTRLRRFRNAGGELERGVTKGRTPNCSTLGGGKEKEVLGPKFAGGVPAEPFRKNGET